MAKRTVKTDQAIVLPILSPILGVDLAMAIIEHRDDVVRVPLTEMAARLQAKEYLATGNPVAAAEMQILRGWRAIRASWYANEIRKDRGGIGRTSDMADFTSNLMDMYNERSALPAGRH